MAGFFARRVTDARFFDAWRASGLPLRRYLMNGLSLDARTLLRSERREAERRRRYATEEAAEAQERARREADAEAVFERAWAKAVVAEACERVRAELAMSGDANAWEVFEAHVMRGESYARIAEGLPREAGGGVAGPMEDALAVVVRRVGRRMRAALRTVLGEEGVSTDEIERELRVVLARLRS